MHLVRFFADYLKGSQAHEWKYVLVTSFPSVLLQDDEEISTSPGVSEFVSDAFDACNLNQEDLRKEMEQLVLDKKKETSVVEGRAIITFCVLNTAILK